jgi:hypothetical protein
VADGVRSAAMAAVVSGAEVLDVRIPDDSDSAAGVEDKDVAAWTVVVAQEVAA